MYTEKYYQSVEWTSYEELLKERPEAFQDDARLPIILDREKILSYMNQTGRKIGVVYRSPYSMMVVDLVRDTQGHCFAYERLMPAAASGAVVMIPRWERSYVLIRQYRHAIRSEQICFPRGFGEPGLSIIENAEKELDEELGTRVQRSQLLGYITPDSGITGSRVGIVYCEVGNPQLKSGHEGIVDILLLSSKELEEAIHKGLITDGFTLAAWSLLKCCHNSDSETLS